MHKSRLIKTGGGGLRGWDFRRQIFTLLFCTLITLPQESLLKHWQEMKSKLLNTDVLMCAWLCVWLCVFEAHILTKIQTEKKRAARRVTATLNIVVFVKVTHLGDQEAYVKGDLQ